MSNKYWIPVAVAVAVSSVVIAWNYQSLHGLVKRSLCSQEKADALLIIERFNRAEKEFAKDLHALAEQCRKFTTGGEKLSDSLRKSLLTLNVDLDFILVRVDAVMGDEEIKGLRKALVGRFHEHGALIEKLLA